MKKFVIFIAIILTALAITLVYFVLEPYLKNKNIALNTNQNVANQDVDINAPLNEDVNFIVVDNETAIINTIDENSISNNTDTEEMKKIVENMTKEEIDTYNIGFTAYEGENMPGQMVRDLLENVVSRNRSNAGNDRIICSCNSRL